MAVTVTFVSGVTTVTLPAPVPGSQMREVKHQCTGVTAGGTRYAYDKGVDRYELDLEFRNLTATQKGDLQSFFHTTVDGVVNTFTYTDSNGTGRTARILDATFEVSKVAKGIWDLFLRLEVDSMGT